MNERTARGEPKGGRAPVGVVEKPGLPSVSVVVVSYYTGPVLFECIASVLAQHEVIDLIIVDNGNNDATRRELEDMARSDKRVKLLSGHGNIGFAAGCNRGANHAVGDYLLLLNPDCILPAGVVGKLVGVLSTHPQAWIVSPRLMSKDGQLTAGMPRNLLTPWTAIVEVLRLDRLAPRHPHFRRVRTLELPPNEAIVTVPAISGAFMLMPRRIYDILGGMDERYFLHVEDLDMCLRVARRGGAILLASDLAVIHVGGTSDAWWPVIELHKARSASQYFYLHFSCYYPTTALWLASFLLYLRFAAVVVLRLLGLRRATSSASGR